MGLIVERKAGGFDVYTRGWRGYCPHEEAVIRRVVAYFHLPRPEEPLGRLRSSVQGFSVADLHNGFYVRLHDGNQEYVPTAAAAMRRVLTLFDDTTPAQVLARRSSEEAQTVTSDALILERIAEGRQGLLTIEERMQALKAQLAPTPGEMRREGQYLDEILTVLQGILDAGDGLLTIVGSMSGSTISAYSENGAALSYIRGRLLELRLSVASWIWVRQNPQRIGLKWRRRAYEDLVQKARKSQQAQMRRWARFHERRERQVREEG